MLSLAEFSMVCEIIADDTCQSGITPEMKIAFMEAMNVLLHGIEAELQIGKRLIIRTNNTIALHRAVTFS